jgi:molybdopterin converting factor small subunit
MSIRVEFYGISRQRAGTAQAVVELNSRGASLGDVLLSLGTRFPEFGASCLDDGRLARWFLANVDGERFVRDPETPLRDGQSLLILSADSGG